MGKHSTGPGGVKGGKLIEINEAEVQEHLGELVRKSVEETLKRSFGRGGGPPLRGRAVRAESGSLWRATCKL